MKFSLLILILGFSWNVLATETRRQQEFDVEYDEDAHDDRTHDGPTDDSNDEEDDPAPIDIPKSRTVRRLSEKYKQTTNKDSKLKVKDLVNERTRKPSTAPSRDALIRSGEPPKSVMPKSPINPTTAGKITEKPNTNPTLLHSALSTKQPAKVTIEMTTSSPTELPKPTLTSIVGETKTPEPSKNPDTPAVTVSHGRTKAKNASPDSKSNHISQEIGTETLAPSTIEITAPTDSAVLESKITSGDSTPSKTAIPIKGSVITTERPRTEGGSSVKEASSKPEATVETEVQREQGAEGLKSTPGKVAASDTITTPMKSLLKTTEGLNLNKEGSKSEKTNPSNTKVTVKVPEHKIDSQISTSPIKSFPITREPIGENTEKILVSKSHQSVPETTPEAVITVDHKSIQTTESISTTEGIPKTTIAEVTQDKAKPTDGSIGNTKEKTHSRNQDEQRKPGPTDKETDIDKDEDRTNGDHTDEETDKDSKDAETDKDSNDTELDKDHNDVKTNKDRNNVKTDKGNIESKMDQGHSNADTENDRVDAKIEQGRSDKDKANTNTKTVKDRTNAKTKKPQTDKGQTNKDADKDKTDTVPAKDYTNEEIDADSTDSDGTDANTDSDNSILLNKLRDEEMRKRGHGRFPVIFIISIVVIIAVYALYHNKQKIIALIVEGKGQGGSRRPNTNQYSKLEDAMPSVKMAVA